MSNILLRNSFQNVHLWHDLLDPRVFSTYQSTVRMRIPLSDRKLGQKQSPAVQTK